MSDKLAPEKRHKFIYNSQTVYEWDQTLQEVNMYIQLPEGLTAKEINCSIKSDGIIIGIKGNPPYLQGQFLHKIISSESFWTVEDGILNVQLTKGEQGNPWEAVIVGHQNQSSLEVEEDRKRLMLERFQLENPGFDFSQAQFSGQVPDAHKFMGGPNVDKK
eukprot:TRINITY_DN19374_c0_g1_i1.p2 TRINITY_DN19374_c0_g1~~TRINITY_DN19374_c0_g1_i1.p2  ORF type:complete len:161 (-),score=18.41 TRINITY_DN19374_c0_g1_i1:504-986(-)